MCLVMGQGQEPPLTVSPTRPKEANYSWIFKLLNTPRSDLHHTSAPS